MKIPKDMVPGTVHDTNDGFIRVIEYRSSKSVDVIFLKTGCKRTSASKEIRNGSIKDLLIPRIYGVGYYGIGRYASKINGKETKAYSVWKGMLERCYCYKRKVNLPTYDGVIVCDEWHNYQNFAKWFYDNHPDDGRKYELDKDIKVDGNKIYSPNTCVFATRQENVEKAWAKNYKFISPNGDTVKIYNLAKFCRENNLSPAHMHQVKSGERSHHKGWTRFFGEHDD